MSTVVSRYAPCIISPVQATARGFFCDDWPWVANFIAQARTNKLVLLRSFRAGQTALAVALALEAGRQGCQTLLAGLQGLNTSLTRADSEKKLEEKLASLCQPGMLIIEETGYLPLIVRVCSASLWADGRKKAP